MSSMEDNFLEQSSLSSSEVNENVSALSQTRTRSTESQQEIPEGSQSNLRLSMTGMMYGPVCSDSDAMSASETSFSNRGLDTVSVDIPIDKEIPEKQPNDEGPKKADETPSEEPLDVHKKKDPPPPVADDFRDEEMGKSAHREKTTRTNNVAPRISVRRSNETKNRAEINDSRMKDQVVGEKSRVDSDSLDKVDRKTCIIFVLAMLVVLAYGGGVYTGVVISSGRDRSMYRITPAPTATPTRRPSAENDGAN